MTNFFNQFSERNENFTKANVSSGSETKAIPTVGLLDHGSST